MKRYLDSLYGRLALVLLLALIAGFGTMYLLFQSHADENRVRNFARTTAIQVNLVEELLHSHPDFEHHPIAGVIIVKQVPEAAPATAEQEDLAARMRKPLAEELGRKPEVQPSSWQQGGLWLALQGVPGGERWMFFPTPKRRDRVEPWAWSLGVSFLVTLVGGMTLLWGVQKPLRRLEQAMGEVNTMEAPPVETGGPREVRRVAEQFNQMIERLRQYDRDRAVMLAGVAHDLRAPLTRLRLQLELDDSPRQPAMALNLDGIESILDQFLAFAQDGEVEKAGDTNLGLLLSDIVAPCRAHGVAVDIPDDEQLRAEVRPASLHRAVCNLIDNALEYGESPVSVSCRRSGDHAVIRVADAGPGISEDRRLDALRPFTRLDTARAGKGHCGLGLAIVDRVVALHHGTLSLLPAIPHGLVVEIRLPLATG